MSFGFFCDSSPRELADQSDLISRRCDHPAIRSCAAPLSRQCFPFMPSFLFPASPSGPCVAVTGERLLRCRNCLATVSDRTAVLTKRSGVASWMIVRYSKRQVLARLPAWLSVWRRDVSRANGLLRAWQVRRVVRATYLRSPLNRIHVSKCQSAQTHRLANLFLYLWSISDSPAGYFRPPQLLSNQTASQAGWGGSHQHQTARPLAFSFHIRT